jgi:hypothetical protein
MSIQSTIELNRQEAEDRLISKLLDEKYRRIARSEVVLMTDKEIEDALEETFDNFMIV